jgi:hypothetical protein
MQFWPAVPGRFLFLTGPGSAIPIFTPVSWLLFQLLHSLQAHAGRTFSE